MSECIFYFRQEESPVLEPVFRHDQWRWCEALQYDSEVASDSDSDNSDLSETLFEYQTNKGVDFKVTLAKKLKVD